MLFFGLLSKGYNARFCVREDGTKSCLLGQGCTVFQKISQAFWLRY